MNALYLLIALTLILAGIADHNNKARRNSFGEDSRECQWRVGNRTHHCLHLPLSSGVPRLYRCHAHPDSDSRSILAKENPLDGPPDGEIHSALNRRCS